MVETALFILAIAFLTYWSGFFSSSEIALFSLPSTKVQAFKSSPEPKKQLIANLLSKPRDLIVTIYILNTLVNILLQNVSSSMFGDASSWWYRVGVPLFITLFIGGILVGFGTRYANGCTSGHAITGISLLNPGSIKSTISFFAGGLIYTFLMVNFF